jgi:hypothetical protein
VEPYRWQSVEQPKKMATSITFTGSPEAIELFCSTISRRRDGGRELVPGNDYRLTFVSDACNNDYKRTFLNSEGDEVLTAISTKVLIGAEIFKKFGNRTYKGIVTKYSKSRGFYYIKYEDGDSEEMERDEVLEHMDRRAPISLVESILWIEESGNRAQSFTKILRAIVNNRPDRLKAIPEIFKRVVNVQVPRDVYPGLWKELGSTEMEKLYYAKRILEAILCV